jgi:iron(III) transport system substrate-binding protein
MLLSCLRAAQQASAKRRGNPPLPACGRKRPLIPTFSPQAGRRGALRPAQPPRHIRAGGRIAGLPCFRTCAGLFGFICALSLTQAAFAQQTGAPLATYQGADREQRLIEGAKREGGFTLYSSMQIESITPLQRAFEAKYGLKVSIWRGAGKDILQRVVTEAGGSRHDVDVMESDSFALEALGREGLLQEVRSPYAADLVPQARQQPLWVGTRVNIVVGVYNTRLVKKDKLPKTYQDLLDPAFKGMLGIEAEDYDWFGMLMGLMGEDKGLKLFRDIVAKNGISVRKGHTHLTNLAAAGEVPIGLTVFMQNVDVARKNGAPVDWFLLPPTIARPAAMGMAKNAPHPNAALLYYDFMLNEGQKIILGRQFVPTSTKIPSVLSRISVNFGSDELVLDQGAKWQKLYDDVLAGR